MDEELLSDDELLFRKQFNEYLKSLPSGTLSQIMSEYPGPINWRMIMIKRSGLKIPPRLKEAIELEEKSSV